MPFRHCPTSRPFAIALLVCATPAAAQTVVTEVQRVKVGDIQPPLSGAMCQRLDRAIRRAAGSTCSKARRGSVRFAGAMENSCRVRVTLPPSLQDHDCGASFAWVNKR